MLLSSLILNPNEMSKIGCCTVHLYGVCRRHRQAVLRYSNVTQGAAVPYARCGGTGGLRRFNDNSGKGRHVDTLLGNQARAGYGGNTKSYVFLPYLTIRTCVLRGGLLVHYLRCLMLSASLVSLQNAAQLPRGEVP